MVVFVLYYSCTHPVIAFIVGFKVLIQVLNT